MSSRGPQPYAIRLALVMTGVALTVVVLFAAIAVLVTRSGFDQLSARRAVAIETAIVRAASHAYGRAGGWSQVDLGPVLALSTQDNVQVEVLDARGHRVGSRGHTLPGGPAPAQLLAVPYRGRVVGDIRLMLPSAYDASLTTLLWHRLALAGAAAGGVSIALGLGVALAVGRRVTHPLRDLAAAVRSVNAGDTGVRVGHVTSALELESLAAGVDELAATLDRQEQLRRNLVADVAHELRTPVSVLQAACEAIVDGVAAPSVEMAASMLEEVHRLGRRIADLDSLVAAETAGLRLARQPVMLSAVAAHAAQAAQPSFAEAGVSLHTALQPCLVEGDPDRLDQVITNLLRNAVKFTPAGGAVDLSVEPSGSDAVVRVTDTGIGIPADDLAMVFGRFWRGRQQPGTAGSGIGLAIVAELVRAHRGEVAVTSEVGAGSTFTVRIPLAPAGARQPVPDGLEPV